MPASRKFQRHLTAHISRSPGNKNLPNSRSHLDDLIAIISIDAKVAQGLVPVHNATSPRSILKALTLGAVRDILPAGPTSFLPEEKA